MTKKILSALLAALMVLALVPMSVFAAGAEKTTTRDGVVYAPVTTIEDSASTGATYLIGYQSGDKVYLVMTKNTDASNNYYQSISGDYFMYGVEAEMDGGNVIGVKTDVYANAALENTEVKFLSGTNGWQIQSALESNRSLHSSSSTNYPDCYFNTTSYANYTKWQLSGNHLYYNHSDSNHKYLRFYAAGETYGSGTCNNHFTAPYCANDAFDSQSDLLFFRKVMPAPTTITVANMEVAATMTAQAQVTFDPSTGIDTRVTYATANTSIATVNETGLVTGVAAGTTTLTVTSAVDPAIKGTATITVTGAVMPDEITVLSDTNVDLNLGGTEQIVWQVNPVNVTNDAVTFESSNTAAATVSDTGLITGTGDGTAVITIKSVADNSITATVNVTVHGPNLVFDFDNGVDPTEDGWTFIAGGSYWQYSSNNSSYAHSGTGAISVGWNSSAANEWAVLPPLQINTNGAVMTLYVKSNSTSYTEGFAIYAGSTSDTASMTAIYTEETVPADSSWHLYTVDLTGYTGSPVYLAICHTAVNMLRMCVDDIYFYGDVQRYAPDPSGIEMAHEVTLVETTSVDFPISVLPAEADQTVSVVIDNTSVATYDATTGKITGVAAGTATLTATTVNNISATAAITVTAAALPEEITGLPKSITIDGEATPTYQLEWTVLPANALDPSVTFTSSDETVATVDENGLITAVGVGSADITVTCVANPSVSVPVGVTVTSVPLPSWHFDTDTDPQNYGWQFVDKDGDGYNFYYYNENDNLKQHTGTGRIRSDSYTSSTGALNADNWAVTPAIHTSADGNTLSFYAVSQDGGYMEKIQVFVGTSAAPADYVNATPALTVEQVPGEYTRYEVMLPADTTCYVLIRHNCSDFFYLFVDTVDVNKVVAPTEISVEDVTVERGLKAELVVTVPEGSASGYTAVVADPTVAVYENGYILGVSGGTTTVTVTSTADETITATANVTVNAAAIEFYFDGEDPITGWTFSPDSSWSVLESDVYSHTGTSMIYSEGSDNWAITPGVQVLKGGATFKFYARSAFASSLEDLEVYVGTTPVPSEMTLVLDQDEVPVNYTAYEIDLADYIGQTVYVAIRHNSSEAYLFVDTVQFWGNAQLAPLVDPEDITVEDVVVEAGSYAQLIYSVSPAGCDNRVTITVADESVAYYEDGYIVGVAAGSTTVTVTSVVDPSLSATANITVISPAIWFDFTEDPLENGWQNISNDGDETDYVWQPNGYMSHVYAEGTNDDLVSPQILIGEGGAYISLDVASYSSNYPETFMIMVGTSLDNLEAITEEITVDSPQVFETLGLYEIPAKFNGQVVYVSIRCTSDDKYYFFVDNVKLWGDAQLYTEAAGPEVTAFQAAIREREEEDGKADVRMVFTVEFNNTYVNWNGTDYGYTGDDKLEITAMQFGLQLEGYNEQFANCTKIFAIDDTTSDVAPYFQVAIAIAGIKEARFSETYNARMIITYGEAQTYESDVYSFVVNDLV